MRLPSASGRSSQMRMSLGYKAGGGRFPSRSRECFRLCTTSCRSRARRCSSRGRGEARRLRRPRRHRRLEQYAARAAAQHRSPGSDAHSPGAVDAQRDRTQLVRRATACKAPRHRWHSWQRRHCGICKLQNLNSPGGFESHPLRQTQSFRFNELAGLVGSVRAMACDANRFFASDLRQKSQVQACSGHVGS